MNFPIRVTPPNLPLSQGKESFQTRTKREIFVLGWISFFNDLGSEVLARLVPLYVASTLGAPMSAVAAIEGVADATATLLKPVFGRLSDRWHRRKVFIVTGYGLSAIARPFLAIATSWMGVGLLRFLDRFGKGIRTAPRDALISSLGQANTHGRNFGINRALDTLGALLGILAFTAWASVSHKVILTSADWRTLVGFCAVPGIIATLLTVVGIRERKQSSRLDTNIGKESQIPLSPPFLKGENNSSPLAKGARGISPLFKRYLAVIAFFGLATSSDAFIFLRAQKLGYSLAEITSGIILLNLVSATIAIPAAGLSDRLGRKRVMMAGWSIYALVYFLLASPVITSSRLLFALLIGFYGLFYGFTESVERAWVADLTGPEDRGRAYGLFGLVTGLMALPANFLLGALWDHWGATVAFATAGSIAAGAVLLLMIALPKKPTAQALLMT